MNVPARQLLLQVDERVFTHLSKLAGELGRSPTRYALELFEAAYAVRCGVNQDPALSAALDGDGKAETGHDDPDLARLRSRAERVPELESKVLRLRSDLAASQREVSRQKATAEQAPKADPAELEAQAGLIRNLEARLAEAAEGLKAASDALELKQAEATQLSRELAEIRAKNELLDSLEKAAMARVEKLEEEVDELEDEARDQRRIQAHWIKTAQREEQRVEEAMAIVRERASLWSEISALQRLAAALSSAPTHVETPAIEVAPPVPIDSADMPPVEAVVALPSSAAAAEAPEAVRSRSQPQSRKTGEQFIWKKSWGKG